MVWFLGWGALTLLNLLSIADLEYSYRKYYKKMGYIKIEGSNVKKGFNILDIFICMLPAVIPIAGNIMYIWANHDLKKEFPEYLKGDIADGFLIHREDITNSMEKKYNLEDDYQYQNLPEPRIEKYSDMSVDEKLDFLRAEQQLLMAEKRSSAKVKKEETKRGVVETEVSSGKVKKLGHK